MTQTNKRNVLITGSSKGIGKAIASKLSKNNYNVYICARNLENLKKTAREIQAAGYFQIDLTQQDSCKTLYEETISKAGNIDILINNAGEYLYSPVEKVQEPDIQRIIKLNVETPYKLIKYVTENMKKNKWGRIINIGSISGVVGEANASLYSMTKACYIGLTKSLALELAEYGITINTINPGWVETELAQNAVDNSDFTMEEELDMIPQKRFIHPDEIASLVEYIVSENAKGMTAQNVSLCAGLSAG